MAEYTLGPGERPRGAGRPLGSKNIYSREASKKLAELGFDPIEEMIKLYDSIEQDIAIEKAKGKPSAIALSNLQNIRQKCINDLMRYGYARTTETSEVINPEDKKPMRIILTHKKAEDKKDNDTEQT